MARVEYWRMAQNAGPSIKGKTYINAGQVEYVKANSQVASVQVHPPFYICGASPVRTVTTVGATTFTGSIGYVWIFEVIYGGTLSVRTDLGHQLQSGATPSEIWVTPPGGPPAAIGRKNGPNIIAKGRPPR